MYNHCNVKILWTVRGTNYDILIPATMDCEL